MSIETVFLRGSINELEFYLEPLQQRMAAKEHCGYYTRCVIEEFELALELSGKLLRKRIACFFASNRQADRLTFKDLFRYAAKHGLMEQDVVERWLGYRDNRKDLDQDFEVVSVEAMLKLLPDFVQDAKAFADMIDEAPDD